MSVSGFFNLSAEEFNLIPSKELLALLTELEPGVSHTKYFFFKYKQTLNIDLNSNIKCKDQQRRHVSLHGR